MESAALICAPRRRSPTSADGRRRRARAADGGWRPRRRRRAAHRRCRRPARPRRRIRIRCAADALGATAGGETAIARRARATVRAASRRAAGSARDAGAGKPDRGHHRGHGEDRVPSLPRDPSDALEMQSHAIRPRGEADALEHDPGLRPRDLTGERHDLGKEPTALRRTRAAKGARAARDAQADAGDARRSCSVCTTERRTARTVPAGVAPATAPRPRAGARRRARSRRARRARMSRARRAPAGSRRPRPGPGAAWARPPRRRGRCPSDDSGRRDPARDHRVPPR